MNLPAPTPPLTTPPDSLVNGLKEAMGLLNGLIESAGPLNEKILREAQAAGDGLRERFPHLDDLTLAAFAAYAAVNIVGTMALDPSVACEHSLEWGLTFAMQAKVLAWSLNTPETPEQS